MDRGTLEDSKLSIRNAKDVILLALTLPTPLILPRAVLIHVCGESALSLDQYFRLCCALAGRAPMR